MNIKIQLQHPNAKAPTYGSDGAACFDLYAATVDGGELGQLCYPGHNVLCDTGVAFEVPDGYVLSIKSRSGLAFNHSVLAFPGQIDSDYRGSVKVLLYSISQNDFDDGVRIEPGQRIAQARIEPAPQVQFETVEQLTLTERGTGGFGSSGK